MILYDTIRSGYSCTHWQPEACIGELKTPGAGRGGAPKLGLYGQYTHNIIQPIRTLGSESAGNMMPA